MVENQVYLNRILKGNVICFWEYTNGRKSGTWYHFRDKGHLMIIQKDFKINTDTVFISNSVKYVYHRCYTMTYYSNGVVKNEGVLLWDEDAELDIIFEYCERKYYDESGRLIRTKVL